MQHAAVKWAFFPCWRTRCSITLGQTVTSARPDRQPQQPAVPTAAGVKHARHGRHRAALTADGCC